MLGLADFGIWTVYMLCILSAVACVVYGLYNWNRGGDDENKQIEEEVKWEKTEEQEIEANL